MKKGNLSGQIKNLLRRGWPYNKIALELGCSKGTIAYHATQMGKGRKRGFYKREYVASEVLAAAVGSKSIAQILTKLGVPLQTGAYAPIREILNEAGVSIPVNGRLIPIREVEDRKEKFVNSLRVYESGKSVRTHGTKLKLISYGMKKAECECCGLSRWNGDPIPLELHHRNGKRKDHRIQNLQLLCPNCHAQTDSYCGRNIGKTA